MANKEVPNIDIEVLKKKIKIKEPYAMETPVIKFFFDSISKWNNKDLSNLLIFVTGYSNIPENMEEDQIFTIHRSEGNKNLLPIAHTCVRELYLPEYETEEDLNKKLLFSVRTVSEIPEDK